MRSFRSFERKAPVRGAARGTAYHIFLQYLDFNRAESLAEVREQLRELKAKGRLTEEEAACIDCRRIRKLAGGTLGKRMAKAQREGCLFREQHFIYAIPADRSLSGGGKRAYTSDPGCGGCLF
ncbi:MAG: hypothetical protein ACLR6B_15610 [Blautia sp.]